MPGPCEVPHRRERIEDDLQAGHFTEDLRVESGMSLGVAQHGATLPTTSRRPLGKQPCEATKFSGPILRGLGPQSNATCTNKRPRIKELLAKEKNQGLPSAGA